MHRSRFDNSCPYDKGNVRSNFVYSDFPVFHDHEYWEFLVLYKGSFTHTINGETMVISHGDAFLIRPEDIHKLISNTEGTAHLNIMLDTNLFESFINLYSPNLLNVLKSKKYIHVSLNDMQIEKFIAYSNLLKQDDSVIKDRDLISSLLISYILDITVEQNMAVINDKPKWLMQLIDRINKQENMAWTVKDVLNEASYSHSHLTREFKKYLNCTIVEYLTRVKIAAASDYLIHSDKTVSEIASILGYDSVSHLNHIFKKTTGTNPLKYRKQFRR